MKEYAWPDVVASFDFYEAQASWLSFYIAFESILRFPTMEKTHHHLRAWAAPLAALPLLAGAAQASTITPGFTFTVANSSTTSFQGTHYHSSTGGDFGNPAGKAEVGSYFQEQARGLSEFNLAGLTTAGPAYVTFNVFSLGGLFQDEGTGLPGNFKIDVYSYAGNNQEDRSDYQKTSSGFLGSFSTAGRFVGETLSFDVNSILDAAIANGDASLGIRLQPTTYVNNGPAITFDNFRLTSDKQGGGNEVPSPLPVLGASAAYSFSRKLRRRITSS